MKKSPTTHLRDYLGSGWKITEDVYESGPRHWIFIERHCPRPWWFLKSRWQLVATLTVGQPGGECQCYSREYAQQIEAAVAELGYETVLHV